MIFPRRHRLPDASACTAVACIRWWLLPWGGLLLLLLQLQSEETRASTDTLGAHGYEHQPRARCDLRCAEERATCTCDGVATMGNTAKMSLPLDLSKAGTGAGSVVCERSKFGEDPHPLEVQACFCVPKDKEASLLEELPQWNRGRGRCITNCPVCAPKLDGDDLRRMRHAATVVEEHVDAARRSLLGDIGGKVHVYTDAPLNWMDRIAKHDCIGEPL